MELKEDGHEHRESPTAGMGSGPDCFGCPASLHQNSGERDLGETRGSSGKMQWKVKRVRESETFENFAKTAHQGIQQGGEGGNRCNWDGSKMPKDRESSRGHSEGKKRSSGNT